MVWLWKVECKTAGGRLVVLVQLIGPGIPATFIINPLKLGDWGEGTESSSVMLNPFIWMKD